MWVILVSVYMVKRRGEVWVQSSSLLIVESSSDSVPLCERSGSNAPHREPLFLMEIKCLPLIHTWVSLMQKSRARREATHTLLTEVKSTRDLESDFGEEDPWTRTHVKWGHFFSEIDEVLLIFHHVCPWTVRACFRAAVRCALRGRIGVSSRLRVFRSRAHGQMRF